MSGLPAWADPELSAELELLAAGGERQDLELKQELPSQMRDLAKEIAAFATSNEGTILVGVADDGVVVGIPNGEDASVRDQLRSRIEGVCSSSIAPLVTPAVRFGVVEGKVVASIDVPKGPAPIYYVSFVPYLRQITAARPMTPSEVVDKVLAWSESRRGASPLHRFICDLDDVLAGADLELHDFQTRIGPWRREAQSGLSFRAGQVRELVAGAPQAAEPAIAALEALADGLESLAAARPSANRSRLETEGAAQEVEELLRTLRARWLAPGCYPNGYDEKQRSELRTTANFLTGLSARIERTPERVETEALLKEAGSRGAEILTFASRRFGMGDADAITRLRVVGSALRTMETRTLHADGGQSENRLRADIKAASQALNAWLGERQN